MKADALLSPKEVEIVLDRAFVEQYANRVTITTRLDVSAAAREPNGKRFDGDFHLAGRSPAVDLPLVVEIVNAASRPDVVDLVHRAADRKLPLTITGAWRIWPEHASEAAEAGAESEAPDTPYPEHVFEIHPATAVDTVRLLDTFRPVKGYRPGGARRTFAIFQKATATIRSTPTTIAVTTQNGLYNDIHFVMELGPEPPEIVSDGRFVVAAARELDGDLLVERVRLVLVKDTAPEHAVRQLRQGGRLHIWGLPRVNYAEIARRVARTAPGVDSLPGSLPYEIVVLAVFER
jgi:hypothetical protein